MEVLARSVRSMRSIRSIRLGRRWWRSAVDPPPHQPVADARFDGGRARRAWRPWRIAIGAAVVAAAITIAVLAIVEHGAR